MERNEFGCSELLAGLQRFWELVCTELEPMQRAGRLKQWLNLLRRRFPEAELAYQQVRVMTDQREISVWLENLAQQTMHDHFIEAHQGLAAQEA